MNIDLQSAGYTEKHRETVRSDYGSAEIFEVYSPSGRFIGFQVYRNGMPEYAPFRTLKGAQVCASRRGSRTLPRVTDRAGSAAFASAGVP
ncbi:MAG TPA: hypothetical protein VE242_12985 [Chthoniobacterales bacterium]|nr:hypothetical protein [Chthoniobacterales bacterium]